MSSIPINGNDAAVTLRDVHKSSVPTRCWSA